MSFGFHCERTGLTYAGTDLAGLFAQRSNLFSARYYRFLFKIVRFCRQGQADLKDGQELGTLRVKSAFKPSQSSAPKRTPSGKPLGVCRVLPVFGKGRTFGEASSENPTQSMTR